jgi:transglutaminase-like putative cysteine protease
MFVFLAMAQAKVQGYVDGPRSEEETLEEKQGGGWAYVKVRSRMVFTKPFLGRDSMVSVQVAHLYRSPRGWLIAEMEELEDSRSPVRLRTGVPEGIGAPPASADAQGDSGKGKGGEAFPAGSGSGSGSGSGRLLPVSERAPAQAGMADRIRYRLRVRRGATLSETCPLGGAQSLVRAVSPSEWIVEVRRLPARASRTSAPTLPPDSTRLYLASNAFLDLGDSALVRRAAAIAGDETDPRRIASAVYAWVAGNFRFSMGSVLFGDSRETVRDPEGDCSEAAILTAALLRARGVPARVALGFASLGQGVFIGHAWCEAWLGGAWVGVDAALREFPAGAERVKLANLDGRGDMRIAATNLMMRTMSNLEIEILGAWKGKAVLPLRRFPDNSAQAGRFFRAILDGIPAATSAGPPAR